MPQHIYSAAAANKALAAARNRRRLEAQKKMGVAPSVAKITALTGPGTAWWKKYGEAYQKWEVGSQKRAAAWSASQAEWIWKNGKRMDRKDEKRQSLRGKPEPD